MLAAVLLLSHISCKVVTAQNTDLGSILDIEFDPDHNQIIVSSLRNSFGLVIFQVTEENIVPVFIYSNGSLINSLNYANSTLISGNVEGELKEFQFNNTWNPNRVNKLSDSRFDDVEIIEENFFMASGPNSVIVWNRSEIVQINPGDSTEDRIKESQYHPIAGEIVIIDFGKTVSSWDMASAEKLRFYGDNIDDFAIDPNSENIATMSGNVINIMNKTGIELNFNKTLGSSSDPDMQYSPNSKYLGIVANDHLEVIDLTNQTQIFTKEDLNEISSIEWVNNHQLVTGGHFGQLILWDILTGQQTEIIIEGVVYYDDFGGVNIGCFATIGIAYLILLVIVYTFLRDLRKRHRIILENRKKNEDQLYPNT